jgi:hypothetical protein
MRISRIGKLARPVITVLLAPLMILLLNVQVISQDVPGKIGNAHWRVDGDIVIITYDLDADAALMYNVVITLVRESDKTFKKVPSSASVRGAIGIGKHAGKERTIRWEYKRDIPEGLSGDGYAFEFNIKIIKEEGGSNLLYYLAGGAVVVGGGVLLLLSGSKTTQTSTSGLPGPPTARPSNQ